MSWNIKYQLLLFNHLDVSLFVRLWVEIIASPKENVALPVSLFVRLWVEISGQFQIFSNWLVSLFVRLWVEICWISRSLVWKQVSLFVRLWVEMKTQWYGRSKVVSASSWGCELKYYVLIPPVLQSASASSWGCELKCVSCLRRTICTRQPLREAVSWNVFIIILVRPVTVSLFVRLWVEISRECSRGTGGRSASS